MTPQSDRKSYISKQEQGELAAGRGDDEMPFAPVLDSGSR